MRAGRRHFIKSLTLAAASLPLAKPAIADPAPETHWRVTSSFQPNLDLIYGGAQTFAAALSDLTDGRFTVAVLPAGDVAPPLEALDAVANGVVECAHTALHYYWGKDPTFVFGSSTPFGMNARQHTAWLTEGGGGQLIDEFLADHKVFALPAGNTGGQMAGWFRKEVHAASDLQGMKVRIGGFAGKVFQLLGAEPVSIPKDGVYSALESGSLDAMEWVGPYDDEKFGERKEGDKLMLSKVAPNYYYPGWWKGGMQLHLIVSREKFDGLPKPHQAALRAAAAIANVSMQAKYDAANPAALKRLVVGGAELRLFPQDVIEACYKTASDLYGQLSASNAN
ncbi:MAG TPA: ABC transporter substrate-binding protein, partial [Roseiarcus sp.]|nr:ABC transporter substrate-binding protein [Roseiarcus sp.]